MTTHTRATSADAVYSAFQMSNACPQRGDFNNGPWGDLEGRVRNSLSFMLDEVWIIAGPIFDDDNGRQLLEKDADHAFGSQKLVEIPDAFYKIIIDVLNGEIRTLAFIMDHSETYGYGEGSSIAERLSGFLVCIDEIEAKTGLDFLWELDDTLEDALEARTNTMW